MPACMQCFVSHVMPGEANQDWSKQVMPNCSALHQRVPAQMIIAHIRLRSVGIESLCDNQVYAAHRAVKVQCNNARYNPQSHMPQCVRKTFISQARQPSAQHSQNCARQNDRLDATLLARVPAAQSAHRCRYHTARSTSGVASLTPLSSGAQSFLPPGTSALLVHTLGTCCLNKIGLHGRTNLKHGAHRSIVTIALAVVALPALRTRCRRRRAKRLHNLSWPRARGWEDL